MDRLKNKVAVVTGGNSGIGLSTAKAFVDEGARVVIFGRDQQRLDNAAETLGRHVLAIQGDVTREADLDRLYQATVKRFGRIDVLFANAGVAELLPIADASEEHFDRVFDTNVLGTLKTVQRAADSLSDNASIILTTSALDTLGIPGMSVYAASKAAVRSLVRTLSAELIDRGIRVNAVSPGPVATQILNRCDQLRGQAPKLEADMATQVPLQRMGEPCEIASAVVFLAADESSYVIGSEIVVDGGTTQRCNMNFFLHRNSGDTDPVATHLQHTAMQR